MLSYQHGFHAGTFADVVKHLVLTRVLSYMVKKEKPFLYLETHSGKGLYDLESREALKTMEASQGIGLLWQQLPQLPRIFDAYMQAISSVNEELALRYYPGSPLLAIQALRQKDRLVLCELHPREYQQLEKLPTEDKRVFFRNEDGVACLNALLPPPEHRGLIFIDPSYELKEEYVQIPRAIKGALKRFATGTYCLWYPIISTYHHNRLLSGMEQTALADSLRLEFYFSPSAQQGMRGTGLWIINPPWTLAAEMKTAFDYLTAFKEGSFYLIKEGLTCV